jgi:mutator protein MutT
MRECVGAIIINQESVPLGKRSANLTLYPKVWDVFGGHVESGESRKQALERELEEELGIVLTVAHYLETLRIPSSTEGDQMQYRLYVVTKWRGTPANQQPEEHSEIKWFRLNETSHLELAAPEYVRIMEDAWQHARRTNASDLRVESSLLLPNTTLQPTIRARGGNVDLQCFLRAACG